jgi:hypothetical protein
MVTDYLSWDFCDGFLVLEVWMSKCEVVVCEVRLLVLAVCLCTSAAVLTAHAMHVVTVLLQVVKLVSFTYGGKLRLCHVYLDW